MDPEAWMDGIEVLVAAARVLDADAMSAGAERLRALAGTDPDDAAAELLGESVLGLARRAVVTHPVGLMLALHPADQLRGIVASAVCKELGFLDPTETHESVRLSGMCWAHQVQLVVDLAVCAGCEDLMVPLVMVGRP